MTLEPVHFSAFGIKIKNHISAGDQIFTDMFKCFQNKAQKRHARPVKGTERSGNIFSGLSRDMVITVSVADAIFA